jgi:CHAT domain-containing protein
MTSLAGDSRWVDLGETRVLDGALDAFRNALQRGEESAFTAAAKTLHETLWKPLETVFPPGTQTIFICPDGNLNFVPFAALSATGQDFVGERYRIAYLGSARDLMREPGRAAGVKKLSVFANPDFSGKGVRSKWEPLHEMRAASLADFGKVQLPPLPGAEAEGNTVARIAKSAGWEADVKLGAAASERALAGLKSPTILHVATHGFFLGKKSGEEPGTDAARGMHVKPVFDGEPAQKAPSAKSLEEFWNPMRRSGLALAGAQRTFTAWGKGEAPEPDSDGVLTAEETAYLDLAGTWLVTLSACETGLGETQSGEGVFGLRRAIMMAGASNLLLTLWPVSDDTTGKIMTDFYTRAFATGKGWETLAEVQRDWLVKLRKEKGLLTAVRDAGPFAMAVMVNPAKSGLE